MSQASLVTPVAKLDIKDLLSPSPSPPPPQPVQPLLTSRSISVPPPCSQCNPTPSPSITSTTSHYTASPAQLTTCNTFAQRQNSPLKQPAGFSGAKQFALLQNPELDVTAETVVSGKRPHPTDEEPICSPAKKSSKWSSAENAKVIRLRSKGVKWNDVSKQMLGRSMTACRLHFQNYLERREPWDEEKKNKLARVYERCVRAPFLISLHIGPLDAQWLIHSKTQIRCLESHCYRTRRSLACRRGHALVHWGTRHGSSCQRHTILNRCCSSRSPETQHWSCCTKRSHARINQNFRRPRSRYAQFTLPRPPRQWTSS